MKRKLFIMIGIATLHVLLGMSTAGAASIGFSPQNSTATVGGSFSVDIVAQGFVELAGGTIDFSYDNTLVEVSSVSIDPYWDFLPDPGSNIAAGEWSNIGFDVFVNTPISGDAVIATITFDALATGIAPLMILSSSQIFSTVELLAPDFLSGSVNVGSAVPLPGAIWMLLSGLGVLACRVGSRKSHSCYP